MTTPNESILDRKLRERAKGVHQTPAASPNKADGKLRRLKVRTMSAIARKPVDWFWPGWIPFGMLSILDGDPELGKSTITADLAARASRGWAMPPEAGGVEITEPVGVIILSAEDSA